MYLIDYHTHSICSHDGQDSMSVIAGAAVAAGLSELCITDHCDLLDEKGRLRTAFDWAPLLAQYTEAQAHYGNRLKLRLGLELGGAIFEPEVAEKIISIPELDFVIGSIHNFNGGEDFYFIEYTSEKQCYEHIEIYLDEMIKLAKWGKFDVLGHITYPLRYMNERSGLGVSFSPYEDKLREIFTITAQSGKGIELNTNRGNVPLPPLALLKLYRECGGEYITVGSDAHCAQQIGTGIVNGMKLLQDAGFRYFTIFERHAPKMVKL